MFLLKKKSMHINISSCEERPLMWCLQYLLFSPFTISVCWTILSPQERKGARDTHLRILCPFRLSYRLPPLISHAFVPFRCCHFGMSVFIPILFWVFFVVHRVPVLRTEIQRSRRATRDRRTKRDCVWPKWVALRGSLYSEREFAAAALHVGPYIYIHTYMNEWIHGCRLRMRGCMCVCYRASRLPLCITGSC